VTLLIAAACYLALIPVSFRLLDLGKKPVEEKVEEGVLGELVEA
jgi:hypothetical protein